MMNQDKFEQLTAYEGELAISIFLPTARGGEEVHNQKNKTELKSQWDQIKREPQLEALGDRQRDALDEKINNLLNDKVFWYHQSDGLAIFLGEDFFDYFRVSISFEPHYHIANSFYIKPLVPIFSSEKPFYLLSLQLEDVHLYEANEHSIKKIEIDELTPSRLEDRVGYDYKEKHLEFRNLADAQGNTQYHGQGASERNARAEIKNYFNAIEKGLETFLNDKQAPLLVMCKDNLFSIYKEVNTYDHLYKKHAAMNPADKGMMELHKEAKHVLEDYFEEGKWKKIEAYKESQPEKKSSMVHDILPAAFEGKIDTLFLEKDEEVWGNYDEENRKVSVDKEGKGISLMDLAAKKVLENDGQVYLLKHAFLPQKESKINALFRY